MAELHRPSRERQRLWGSLKRRFSESRASRRRLSIDDMKDEGGESALPLFDDQEDTDVRIARTRKRSGEKVHRKSRLACSTRNDSTAVMFPPIFCTRKSRLPENDETCSTKPNVGLATRYNQQFVQLWLAESVRSKVTESTERTSSLPSSESSCQSPVMTGLTKDSCSKPQLRKQLSSEPVVPTTPVDGGLVGEISRLSSTLDRASIDNHEPPSCANRQDCNLDASTVTSNTSSDLTPSEFSFADFGQKSEIDPTDSGKETTIEDIFQQHANTLLNIYDYNISQGHSGQARGFVENKALWTEAARLARKTNLSPVCQGDREKAEGTELATPPLGFDPVLAGCHTDDDIMVNEGFLTQDISYRQCNPNQQIPDTVGVLDAQAVFRHLDQQDRQRNDWLEDPQDPHDIFEDPDDDWQDVFIQEICLSQDESHILSEMTDNTVSYAEQVDPGEHATGGVTYRHHGCISKKAPCFVFYNEACPADSEAFRISAARASLPIKVKDVIARIEERKRLEADQAERFGYKDFIPIQDQSIVESVTPAGPTSLWGQEYFTESEVSQVSTASF